MKGFLRFYRTVQHDMRPAAVPASPSPAEASPFSVPARVTLPRAPFLYVLPERPSSVLAASASEASASDVACRDDAVAISILSNAVAVALLLRPARGKSREDRRGRRGGSLVLIHLSPQGAVVFPGRGVRHLLRKDVVRRIGGCCYSLCSGCCYSLSLLRPLLPAGNVAFAVRALALADVALVARRGWLLSEVHPYLCVLATTTVVEAVFRYSSWSSKEWSVDRPVVRNDSCPTSLLQEHAFFRLRRIWRMQLSLSGTPWRDKNFFGFEALCCIIHLCGRAKRWAEAVSDSRADALVCTCEFLADASLRWSHCFVLLKLTRA